MAASTQIPEALRETASRPEQVPGEKTFTSTGMVEGTAAMLQVGTTSLS